MTGKFPAKFLEVLEKRIARARVWSDSDSELVLRLLATQGEVPIDEERIGNYMREQEEAAAAILGREDGL